jgi:DHA1 family bicyclomycin/chloramphenicol resistance-like MFS transporter
MLFTLLIMSVSISFLIVSHMFAPFLPQIASEFHILESAASEIMVVNYSMLAITALFWGRLSDKIGRRPVLIMGMTIYTMGGFIMCFYPTSFHALVMARGLQGIGEGVIPVCTAALKDRFNGQDYVRYISRISMVMALGPSLGPLIGTILASEWSMLGPFIASTSLIILMGLYGYLPETLNKKLKNPVEIDYKAPDYATFWNWGLMQILCVAGFMGFSNYFPDLAIESMGMPKEHYGYCTLIGSMLYMIGNAILQKRLPIRTTAQLLSEGVCLWWMTAFLMTIFYFNNALNPWIIQCVLGFAQFGSAFLIMNVSRKALEAMGSKTGLGASLMVFTQMMGGSLLAYVLTSNFDGTMKPLITWYFLLCCALTTLLIVGLKRERRESTLDNPALLLVH